MKGYLLSAENITPFVAHLMTKKKVYAPHNKGDHSFSFKEVTDPDKVVLEYSRTLNSIKKFFLPMRETLLSFKRTDNSFEKPEINPADAIFFGVHNYDLAAVFKLDYNFKKGNAEKNYLTRRENSVFIGVSYEPDKFHFSESVGIAPNDTSGFDLFLHKTNTGYVVEICSDTGASLLEGFSGVTEFEGDRPETPEYETSLYAHQSKLLKVFDDSYNNPVWDEMAEKCVSCGTCNLTCPTCYCFNVEDHLDLNIDSGERVRHLDGCMLRNFTAVAGGEVFREDVGARIRHRIYRKFKYISDQTGEPWCVGCGRCTIYCTAGISIVDIVNRLVTDYDKQQVLAAQGDLATAME